MADDPADTPTPTPTFNLAELASPSAAQVAIDTSVAHPARLYDYLLGGKDNFAADRVAAAQVLEITPHALVGVRANRAFLRRCVEYLVREAGIRQFLDLGTGLPTVDNTHEVAQALAPECRIVYVDNDPIVLIHARALLTGTAEGATSYVDADVRDTDKILAAAAETLDLDQPVAVMALTILQYIPDSDGPHQVVARLLGAMPSGSYLTVSDLTRDVDTVRMDDVASRMNANMGDITITMRTRDKFIRYFDGLELVEPGVVPLTQWRAEADAPDAEIPLYAGMGRKP